MRTSTLFKWQGMAQALSRLWEIVSPTVQEHSLGSGHVCGLSNHCDNSKCDHWSFIYTYWNSQTAVLSLRTCKKFLHKPWPAKFSKSNFKLSVLFHTISPHLTLSFAKNFSLLGLFSFHFTSANLAQNDKQLHSAFPPLRWGVFPTRKQTALYRNKAHHSLADWKKSMAFIHSMLFIHSKFNFLFNSAESVCFLLNQFLNPWHLQCTSN